MGQFGDSAVKKRHRRLAVYTFVVNPAGLDELRAYQIRLSISSLREHNPDIGIALLLSGRLPRGLARELKQWNVTIFPVQSYSDRLRALTGHRGAVFDRYLTLQKWIYLDEIDGLGADSVILLDFDTCFAQDIERLFDKYSSADWYSREEVFTSKSPDPCAKRHAPHYVDETKVRVLGKSLRLRPVPCVNLGVVLLNHKSWRTLAKGIPSFFDVLWRFYVWMALNPVAEERSDVIFLREHMATLVTPVDRGRALQYPSQNRWIKDGVSMTLVLGGLEMSVDLLRAEDSLQGIEFQNASDRVEWTLLHYFTILAPSLIERIRNRQRPGWPRLAAPPRRLTAELAREQAGRR